MPIVIAVIVLILPILFWILLRITRPKNSGLDYEVNGLSFILIIHNEEGLIERKLHELIREMNFIGNRSLEFIIILTGAQTAQMRF